MKLNIANPWTRFYLSCGAVVVMFFIFFILYSLYKHPYYGPRFLGINFFEEKSASAYPLYEINAGTDCVKLVEAEKLVASTIKSLVVEAHSPACKTPFNLPAEAKQLPKDSTIEIALFIKPDGAIKRADLNKTSGSDIVDTLLLEQIKNTWQFEPCKKSGVAIECRQVVRVKWIVK